MCGHNQSREKFGQRASEAFKERELGRERVGYGVVLLDSFGHIIESINYPIVVDGHMLINSVIASACTKNASDELSLSGPWC
jgi:hypothetical protein